MTDNSLFINSESNLEQSLQQSIDLQSNSNQSSDLNIKSSSIDKLTSIDQSTSIQIETDGQNSSNSVSPSFDCLSTAEITSNSPLDLNPIQEESLHSIEDSILSQDHSCTIPSTSLAENSQFTDNSTTTQSEVSSTNELTSNQQLTSFDDSNLQQTPETKDLNSTTIQNPPENPSQSSPTDISSTVPIITIISSPTDSSNQTNSTLTQLSSKSDEENDDDDKLSQPTKLSESIPSPVILRSPRKAPNPAPAAVTANWMETYVPEGGMSSLLGKDPFEDDTSLNETIQVSIESDPPALARNKLKELEPPKSEPIVSISTTNDTKSIEADDSPRANLRVRSSTFNSLLSLKKKKESDSDDKKKSDKKKDKEDDKKDDKKKDKDDKKKDKEEKERLKREKKEQKEREKLEKRQKKEAIKRLEIEAKKQEKLKKQGLLEPESKRNRRGSSIMTSSAGIIKLVRNSSDHNLRRTAPGIVTPRDIVLSEDDKLKEEPVEENQTPKPLKSILKTSDAFVSNKKKQTLRFHEEQATFVEQREQARKMKESLMTSSFYQEDSASRRKGAEAKKEIQELMKRGSQDFEEEEEESTSAPSTIHPQSVVPTTTQAPASPVVVVRTDGGAKFRLSQIVKVPQKTPSPTSDEMSSSDSVSSSASTSSSATSVIQTSTPPAPISPTVTVAKTTAPDDEEY